MLRYWSDPSYEKEPRPLSSGHTARAEPMGVGPAPEALVMPTELAQVDELPDDPAFFEPFRPFFDPDGGRRSISMETFLAERQDDEGGRLAIQARSHF
jgi:hypothetical protein